MDSVVVATALKAFDEILLDPVRIMLFSLLPSAYTLTRLPS
jgi:hypothetical protein